MNANASVSIPLEVDGNDVLAVLHESWEPDMEDQATLGCVLAQVREAWGIPGLTARRQHGGTWTIWEDADDADRAFVCVLGPMMLGGDLWPIKAETEAEAWVICLEQHKAHGRNWGAKA